MLWAPPSPTAEFHCQCFGDLWRVSAPHLFFPASWSHTRMKTDGQGGRKRSHGLASASRRRELPSFSLPQRLWGPIPGRSCGEGGEREAGQSSEREMPTSVLSRERKMPMCAWIRDSPGPDLPESGGESSQVSVCCGQAGGKGLDPAPRQAGVSRWE